MRKGMLRTWAGVVGLTALALGTAHGQEAGPGKPAGVQQPPSNSTPAVPAALQAEAVPGKPAEVQLPPADSAPAQPLGPESQADGHTVQAAQAELQTGPLSGFEADGQYLLLKPNRTAMDIAITAPNVSSLPVGSVDNLDYQTRSGFSAGIGYHLPTDGWEIMVNYTHLDSTASREFNAPSGGTLLATQIAGGGNELVNTALGTNSFQYHVIDLEVSKYCSVGDSFAIRFFGGGRFAIIDQNLSVGYSGGTLGASSVNVNSPVDFDGGGLTAGAEGTWHIWHGLGLYGSGRAGLLAGTFTTDLTETTAGRSDVIAAVSDKYYQIVPLMEIGAGLCWQSEHWHFKVGYEIINYFSMVNSINFPDFSSVGHITRNTSNLSLDGLACELGFVF